MFYTIIWLIIWLIGGAPSFNFGTSIFFSLLTALVADLLIHRYPYFKK